MDIGKIINQAIKILINPKESLRELKDIKVNRNDIIIYLGVVSIPTFFGNLIGFGYGGLWGQAAVRSVVFCILAVIGIILAGYLFNEFAPHFKSQKNLMQSVKLIVYSFTPWLIAGILWAVPLQWVWVLSFIAGLYGLYILYLGLPLYMGTPKDEQIIYLLVGLVFTGVVMAVTAYIARVIWISMILRI